VRPLAELLRAAGDTPGIDFALTSEPFATQRADYIRASLAVRIRRCLATVCLFGPETLSDDWVLWTLATARYCGRPIVATSLDGAGAPQAMDLFAAVGAVLVPARAEAIARHVARLEERRRDQTSATEAAALVLRAMRHQMR
jgi:Thoeris protein ThsB, TIR-like domain